MDTVKKGVWTTMDLRIEPAEEFSPEIELGIGKTQYAIGFTRPDFIPLLKIIPLKIQAVLDMPVPDGYTRDEDAVVIAFHTDESIDRLIVTLNKMRSYVAEHKAACNEVQSHD